ncbi:MAG: hypothetical protein DCF16_02185 [Alphaproteobacteria bacterium]|nr:MAG: hypothetical protein DCF16_02185 [Alphaproteobacteria bacterium]
MVSASELGVVLALLGTVGVFVFGAPFRIRRSGETITFVSDNPNSRAQAADRLFDVLSWASLVLIIVGAALQLT